jgi:hypothetical protein
VDVQKNAKEYTHLVVNDKIVPAKVPDVALGVLDFLQLPAVVVEIEGGYEALRVRISVLTTTATPISIDGRSILIGGKVCGGHHHVD